MKLYAVVFFAMAFLGAIVGQIIVHYHGGPVW